MASLVGSRLRRLEDPALLRGRARFVDDIRVPGLLHVAFVRSTEAHAGIRGIDRSAAVAMAGVHAVLAIEDLDPVLARRRMPLGFRGAKLPPDVTPFVLANGEACYVGEAIALVVAESRPLAEDAAALVAVDYEALPAVADCRDAVAPGAPKVRREVASNVLTTIRVGYGDPDAAFAGAAHRVTVELAQHRGAAHPIEGRGLVVEVTGRERRLLVRSSTQMPHALFQMAAEVLGLDENLLRVATPDVGGGFGCKYVVYPEELAVIAAARLLGRSLKWVEDRREHFLAAIQERDQHWSLELALAADGRIRGIRGRMLHDQGAYTPQDVNLAYNSATSVTGPYIVPSFALEVVVAETNKPPAVPVRGAGYPEAAFAMERLMDRAARALGLDRAEIRRRNLIPPEKLPYEKPLKTRAGSPIVYDSGDFPACQAEVLAAIGWADFAARKAEGLRRGHHLGIGLGHAVKGTGRGPFESGIVRIAPSGRVAVFTGAAAMGQGLATALAQISAEALGVAPEAVSVVAGDTAASPLGLGGFGSRQLVTAGSSVRLAAEAVAAKAKRLASHLLEAAEADLELVEGRVRVAGAAEVGVSLGDLARVLRGAPGYAFPAGIDPGLEATFHFRIDQLAYTNACHAAIVEVDVETGGVRILDYVAMQDSGRLVNPLIVEGQVQGGVAHGIGNALLEWMGYDEKAQPLTTTFAEYLLASATEVPTIATRFKQSPSPLNPLGAKGAGEVGTIPVAATIIAAVEDALSPFGVTISETPIFPARIVELVRGG